MSLTTKRQAIAAAVALILLGAGGMLNAGAIVMGVAAGIVLGDTLARPLTRGLASNERRRARRR